MFRVYESRDSIPSSEDAAPTLLTHEVCLTSSTHQALVASLATALLLLVCTSAWAWIVYKKTRALDLKNRIADGVSESSSSTAYLANSGPFLVSDESSS